MSPKEIIEFTNSDSVASSIMEPVVKEFLSENPEVSYSRIDCDKDPEIVKMFISSQLPTISPFFVSFYEGKISNSASGILSKEDLKNL